MALQSRSLAMLIRFFEMAKFLTKGKSDNFHEETKTSPANRDGKKTEILKKKTIKTGLKKKTGLHQGFFKPGFFQKRLFATMKMINVVILSL